MAKTVSLCFAPLFLGLILISSILMTSQGVNAGCADFELSATRVSIDSQCQDQCISFFGDKLLSYEAHDMTWWGRFKCACCYTD
ncbi:hypothetical protein MKX01_001395 [Papaver californicum]|nr:hypothetical protein MKX01_001395 [Papaver californicum]